MVGKIAGRDEIIYFTVRVAGDVLYCSGFRRLFIEPGNRDNREYLVDGPGIRKRLEQREIAEILVRQHFGDFLQFVRSVLCCFRHGIYLAGYGPEQPFHLCSGTEINQSQIEKSQCIFPALNGIVPRFEQTGLVEVFPQVIQLFH